METTTVFTNGPSTQAVRIPRKFRLSVKEVWIEKIGDSLLIKPKPASWDDFFQSPLRVSDDFSMERNQRPPQDRGDLFS